LRADIVALPHSLRRIVVFPEGLQKGFEASHSRIEHNTHNLIVPGGAGASLLVGRIRGEASRIADGGGPDARAKRPELPFRAPEASHTEQHLLETGGDRSLQGRPQHECLSAVGIGAERPGSASAAEGIESGLRLKNIPISCRCALSVAAGRA